jgi:hypothetical protein
MTSGCIVETDKEATKTGDSDLWAEADGTADHHTTHPTITVRAESQRMLRLL